MATPQVSGAAAPYAGLNPNASAAQIKAAPLNAAIPTPSLQGKAVPGRRLVVSSV